MKVLTVRERKFVEEYVRHGNGLEAAVTAGYAPSGAKSIASKLLRRPHIAAALEARAQKIADKAGITTERILEEYRRLAFLDPRVFFDNQGNLKSLSELSEEAAAAIAGLEVDDRFTRSGEYRVKKLKIVSKLGALDSLSRIRGLFQDKMQVPGLEDFAAALVKARERARAARS